ncbi:MAG: prepilin-type N-terminal cleavage/methylation domain-containing protein [Planctomycetota bacterium]|nr:prepilin-type N-terminal cleavage/methylation domain-containing protein [Planctomycetota bacterium]
MRLQRNRHIWNDWFPKNPVHHQRIRRGFSLVELVVYVAVVAILAISFIRVLDHTEKAKVASVAKTARLINDVASTIFATTGAWPADVNNSILPTSMNPFLSTNTQSIFANDTPLKGRWDWNGPTNAVSNLIGISLRFNPPSTADQQLLTKLDILIDDGDLDTGSCRKITNSGSLFYVISVATKN